MFANIILSLLDTSLMELYLRSLVFTVHKVVLEALYNSICIPNHYHYFVWCML